MTQPPAGTPPPEQGLPKAALPEAAAHEAPPTEAGPSQAALFEVVRGDATAEEIAALTAVLAALAAASRRNVVPAHGPTGVSSWAERSRLVRRPLAHAPAGWRASACPG
jgi:Ser/Thr protein kinase RdoA (MazF antagonist)